MSNNFKPQISVVICTYNRVRFIQACLEHLFHQDLNKEDYEVLIINNNCNDGTTELVDNFIQNHPRLNIKQIIETNQGLSFARNRGFREAQSKLITYIDDDGEAFPNLLSSILSYFKSHQNVVGAGGKVIPKYETEKPKWLTHHLRMMVTDIDYGETSFKCFGKKYPAGCNMTYRKEILQQVGGFNEALKWRVDDKYIFHEVSKISDEIYYIPEWKVKHNIDAQRVTDENFDKLSYKLGQEEKIRIQSINKWHYPFKVFEYFAKFLITFALAIKHTLLGKPIIGKYLIRFRWLALKGLIA